MNDLQGGSDDTFAFAMVAFTVVFLSFFVLIGLVVFVPGVYSLVNTLEVTLSEREITSTRRVLGVPFIRRAWVEDVARVEASIQGHVGQGARANVFYDLRAFLESGGRIVLGDDVPRPELAERLCRLVTAETGLPAEIAPRRKGIYRGDG